MSTFDSSRQPPATPAAAPCGRVRAFLASSVDGFIAGEGDDLSWLPQPGAGEGDGGFGAFLSTVGAVLMGRRTYDVVAGFGGTWPYGDRPVHVATRRALAAAVSTVRPVAGGVDELVREALAAAGGRDVYLDGGELLRQALDAEVLDELTVTVVPVVLGTGRPLGAGTARRHALALTRSEVLEGGLVQLTYRRG